MSRCGITLSGGGSTVPASGGAGALSVGATRECAWSASVEGNWLSIRAGSSGQGEGTVEFAAAANPDPQTRTGALIVNGSRAQISQAAGECVLTLDTSSADFPTSGGSATVQVRASSTLCSWTAAANEDWITVSNGTSGRGNGSTTITVAATTGPPRAGSVTIAGQQYSVTQAQGCSYTVDNATHSVSAAGGGLGVRVTTAPTCPWTAASNVPWITVSPATAVGPGTVALTVAGTEGPQRSGTVVVAGQIVTVTQSPGCSYSVDPETRSVSASGGTSSVRVTTAAACSWTASSNVPWISVQGSSSGVGSADVTFSAAATDGAGRTGTLTIAGRTVTVTQAQGCQYALAPERQNVAASGGSGTVAVTAGSGCAWTATSSASWLTITAGSNGTGNGEVQFTAAATSGAARSATLTIGGRTFTVDQGQGCSYSLSAAGTSVANAGGTRSFDVQAADGCAWTAAANAPWISITAGSSGSGSGTISFTVAPNSGPDRTGTITAGGQTFTVSQTAGCTFSIAPGSRQLPASGGVTTTAVTAPGSCAWTAATNDPWISITAGGSGTGDGTVSMSVAPNTGAARAGTVTIAGQTFTVNQSGGCTFAIAPASRQLPAAGGATTTAVKAPGSCAWTTASNVPWIAVTDGASGTGNGTVEMTVAANTGAARTGTVTVAGETFTVSQEGGCTFSVTPENPSAPAAGGSIRIQVKGPAGCAWSAAANVPWISAPENTGMGTAAIDLTVAANTGPARSGTATVAGRTVTVSQSSGCTIGLKPTSQTVPKAGGNGSVAVAAAAGCAWTAVSSEGWLTITSGASGSGNGTVQFNVRNNQSPRGRTATITIGGQVFTVSQQ